ncbi:unnamed protein product [Larinioides sclopetarius]|uniref:Uncharacterized protein n=1 Tax=Larinioides sclopetarius TaxID=280406 RepID=A0AAV1ZJB5_9ARAC
MHSFGRSTLRWQKKENRTHECTARWNFFKIQCFLTYACAQGTVEKTCRSEKRA